MLLGGVVHQDIEPPELLNRLRHRLLAKRLVTNIAGDQHAAPILLYDHPACLLGVAMLIEVDNRHVGALFCEDNCDGAAYSTVAAGDQGNHAPQLAARFILAIISLWARCHLGLESRPPLLMLRWLLLVLRSILCHGWLLRFFKNSRTCGASLFPLCRFFFAP